MIFYYCMSDLTVVLRFWKKVGSLIIWERRKSQNNYTIG